MRRMEAGESRVAATDWALRLAPADRTLQQIVARQGERLGGRAALTTDGISLGYADLPAAAARFAGTLARAGVERGDRVVLLSENRWEVLQCLLGCAWVGAVLVPINTASRGAQLQHILTNADPKVVAAEAELLDRVASVPRPGGVAHLWRIGPGPETRWEELDSTPFPEEADAVEPSPVGPGDPLAILYTSGTTGPSKGVVCPHAQFYWWGVNVGSWLDVRPDDTLYTCLPLFHTNALNAFVQALLHGARFAVGPRFSASRFWERVAAADATVTYLLGAMVSILSSHEASPEDRAHRVRVALAPATPLELWSVFRTRFGIEIVDGHGMTETNGVVGPRDGEQRAGWMGRVMPGFEARVVDEDDAPVPDGTAGELVMRASEPHAFASGYWRMPEATVAAWRNMWFHSGDRVVAEDGWLRFLDRMKDAIRRRGENVSAWEVEQVLLQHEKIESVAVIPVPAELGEDEVMACVAPLAGATVEPVELVRFCEPRLPYFAIPRYIELFDALPLTENGKIQKFVLRERGVTAATWDREAAGIAIKR
jgi:crotonobetaine/carnitine-CoA ligase